MENASKALIIAGAILLAILIISLGIMIYNQAAGVVNNNSMSEVEIQEFNQKFTQYEGTRVRGATVNSMLQSVLANNTSQDDNQRKISVNGSAGITMGENDTTLPQTRANTGAIYSVTCNYGTGARAGLVVSITINNT